MRTVPVLSRSWLRVGAALFAIGWGANQFAPLVFVYRQYDSSAEVTALFGAYALGLIPAFLVAAPLSDRFGRRRIVRPVLILSVIASIVLLLGAHSVALLLIGRLLAGVASGAAFGPGTAWIKELSADAPAGSGARRAAVSLSSGFAAGPLVAGIAAQLLPDPASLPYLVHIALVVGIAPFAWNAPETVGERPVARAVREAELWQTLRSSVFLRKVVPSAPWVFGAASTALVVLPGIVDVGRFDVIVSGGAAGVTLGTGVLIQPFARRVALRTPGLTLHLGIASLVVGLLLASVTALTRQPVLLIPCAIILGSAYGMLLIAGLTTVQDLASPDDLATVTAVFYCLTYIGFAFPLIVAELSQLAAPPLILVGAAALAIVTWPIMLRRTSLPAR